MMTNTHRGPRGGSSGRVIPTTVSASACGLCSQLEPDAADHWRARSSGPRTREANPPFAVSLPGVRHLSQFPAQPARSLLPECEPPCGTASVPQAAYPGTARCAGPFQITRWGKPLQFEYRPADRRQRRPNGPNWFGSRGTGVVAKGTLQVARPFFQRGGPAV